MVITPRSDTVAIATGKWKQGDFRLGGHELRRRQHCHRAIGDRNGLCDRHGLPRGAFDIRLRNGAAPATNPGTVYVDSNLGGTAGPFTIPNG